MREARLVRLGSVRPSAPKVMLDNGVVCWHDTTGLGVSISSVPGKRACAGSRLLRLSVPDGDEERDGVRKGRKASQKKQSFYPTGARHQAVGCWTSRRSRNDVRGRS